MGNQKLKSNMAPRNNHPWPEALGSKAVLGGTPLQSHYRMWNWVYNIFLQASSNELWRMLILPWWLAIEQNLRGNTRTHMKCINWKNIRETLELWAGNGTCYTNTTTIGYQIWSMGSVEEPNIDQRVVSRIGQDPNQLALPPSTTYKELTNDHKLI